MNYNDVHELFEHYYKYICNRKLSSTLFLFLLFSASTGFIQNNSNITNVKRILYTKYANKEESNFLIEVSYYG